MEFFVPSPFCFCMFFGRLFVGRSKTIFPEQQRNTPQRRKADQCKNDSAYQGSLTAEKPSDKVKLENSNRAPVDSADNDENQCNDIDHSRTLLSKNHGTRPAPKRPVVPCGSVQRQLSAHGLLCTYRVRSIRQNKKRGTAKIQCLFFKNFIIKSMVPIRLLFQRLVLPAGNESLLHGVFQPLLQKLHGLQRQNAHRYLAHIPALPLPSRRL